MIQEKIREVLEKVEKAALRSGRKPSEVTLVLVTKNVPPLRIREAFEAGAREFGENRLQELLQKKPELDPAIRWHFVGRLQTNKVKSLVGEVGLLHSLDRLELLEEIQKQAEKKDLKMDSLIQINTTGEATKAGFAPEKTEAAVEAIRRFPRIQLRGLMTIGPLQGDEGSIRKSFARLRELRDGLHRQFPDAGIRELSMGMSSDFEWAVEEGATLVRIGTAVFGERKP